MGLYISTNSSASHFAQRMEVKGSNAKHDEMPSNHCKPGSRQVIATALLYFSGCIGCSWLLEIGGGLEYTTQGQLRGCSG